MTFAAPVDNYDLLLDLAENGSGGGDTLNDKIAAVNADYASPAIGCQTIVQYRGARSQVAGYPAYSVGMLDGPVAKPTTRGIVTTQRVQVVITDTSADDTALQRRMQGYQTALTRLILDYRAVGLSVQIELEAMRSDPRVFRLDGGAETPYLMRTGVEVTITRGEEV